MAYVQVLKGGSATIQETFAPGGTPTDLDASAVPAVTMTRPDGTAGPASGTVTHVGAVNSGTYQFVFDAQAEVTILSATWTGNIGGKAQTLTSTIEVVGDWLYDLGSLRNVKVAGGTPFSDAGIWPSATLAAKRIEVTLDFEARTGYSFVPRFAREVLDGDGSCDLMLRQLRCSKLLSVTIDGTAQQASDFTLSSSGVLSWKSGGWFSTVQRQNVAVEYRYGFDQPSPAVSTAALLRTAMLLQPSQFAGAVTVTTPDGASYSYSQAGQSFQGGGIRHYGWPDIDAVLTSPAYSALGAAFA